MNDFPVLFSDDEIDALISKKHVSASAIAPRRLMSDSEQLIHSIAAVHLKFPHIVKKVKLMWGTDELQHYLAKLINETERPKTIQHPEGGKRQGFPPEMMSHLLKIHNIHFRSLGNPLPSIDWRGVM